MLSGKWQTPRDVKSCSQNPAISKKSSYLSRNAVIRTFSNCFHLPRTLTSFLKQVRRVAGGRHVTSHAVLAPALISDCIPICILWTNLDLLAFLFLRLGSCHWWRSSWIYSESPFANLKQENCGYYSSMRIILSAREAWILISDGYNAFI